MKKTLGIMFYFVILLFIPYASAGEIISETIYLNVGQSNVYNIGTTVGDKLHWSFRTYSSPFEVMMVSQSMGTFSQGKTEDNGILTIPLGDTGTFWVYNWDDSNNGYIAITFEINPTPNIDIPGYSIIFIISIIALISALIYIKLHHNDSEHFII